MNRKMFTDQDNKFNTLVLVTSIFEKALLGVSGVGLALWGSVISSNILYMYDENPKVSCAAQSIMSHASDSFVSYLLLAGMVWLSLAPIKLEKFYSAHANYLWRAIALIAIYIFSLKCIFFLAYKDIFYFSSMSVLPENTKSVSECYKAGYTGSLFGKLY